MLTTVYRVQAAGAAGTVGSVLAALVYGHHMTGEPWPALSIDVALFVVLYFGWLMTPFAVLHVATRFVHAYPDAVKTPLVASVVIVVGSAWILFVALFRAPAEGGSIVVLMLPVLQLVVLAPFLFVAWLRR